MIPPLGITRPSFKKIYKVIGTSIQTLLYAVFKMQNPRYMEIVIPSIVTALALSIFITINIKLPKLVRCIRKIIIKRPIPCKRMERLRIRCANKDLFCQPPVSNLFETFIVRRLFSEMLYNLLKFRSWFSNP
jgi:hypothetical protein